jgi:thiosulfate dehydrogenase
MKFTTFAIGFGTAFLAVALTTLALRTPSSPPPAPNSPARGPTSWPDYGVGGPGFSVPAGEDGPMIAYGYELVARTYANIGPEVPDKAQRFAGNNLACQNCHLDVGTNRFGLPLVGIYKTFPKYSARSQRVISLTDRLNECMTRSMNGRPLPEDSREMQALLAFVRYIGNPAPQPAPPPAATAALAPAAARGAEVFAKTCANCHQQNGLGVRRGSVGDAEGYLFPPLWGQDSFNDGAGMDRYDRIVGFVLRNMPRGVDPQHPQLTLQQAWDVAAYVIAQPRPHYGASR